MSAIGAERHITLGEIAVQKKLEMDAVVIEQTILLFPAPTSSKNFQEGWRECIRLYALHKPNRRALARLLDEHCVLLENECIRSPTRENYAIYEGFRAAIKELVKQKALKIMQGKH